MSQTRPTATDAPSKNRPSTLPASMQSAGAGANDRVTVSGWIVDPTNGQLYTEATVTAKNAGDTVAFVSLGLYFADPKISDPKPSDYKPCCWGLVSPETATSMGPSVEASMATNLYNPSVHGTKLLGILSGDLDVASRERLHFSIQQKFTITI